MRNVGLIGFGSIGARVAAAIARGDAGGTILRCVLVREPSRHTGTMHAHKFTLTESRDRFIEGLDLVVECAGHQAVRDHAEWILSKGCDLVVLSAGAFADHNLLDRVVAAATAAGKRVVIPSGAIAGLDGLGAAALGRITYVTHVVRKPPRAFSDAQLANADRSQRTLLFSGRSQEGVGLFPENVNVAAAVSLAGIGFQRTQLDVVSDPTVTMNTHEIDAAGEFGRLRVTMENNPSENPKTGTIVAMSVIKVLRQMSAPLVVGA